MKEQTYIIENNTSFEPKHIFECGQCFRWNEEPDGSYTGIINKSVLNVKKQEERIIIKGMSEQNLEEVVEEYFDLKTDYEKLKEQLASIDEHIKNSIVFGKGIRILNQDVWETIISFIISANNNIPRIKGIIERLSKAYGEEIIWKEKAYYTFPTMEQLAKASVEDLRKLGFGFRDKRVYDTTRMFLNQEITIEELQEEKEIENLREKLLQLPGVGPKVADCIMLFGLKKLEVFPIDVWVRRVMNELYIKQEDETKVSKAQIETLAKEKYANLAGLAQQYLFYWKRETA